MFVVGAVCEFGGAGRDEISGGVLFVDVGS